MMENIKVNNLYTIGFAGKTAEEFFDILKKNNIKTLVDIRANNKSQLAGFTKGKDLEFFLNLFEIKYIYFPDLAPPKELLKDYREKKVDWDQYEEDYKNHINNSTVDCGLFDSACLLCSEPTAEKCHRRLAAEYIKSNCSNISIKHL